MTRIRSTVAMLTLCGLSVGAQAALYDRGNGMIYDSALNITWLQDAGYSGALQFGVENRFDWEKANAWVGNLNYQGITGWRLPSARPIGNNSTSYNGSTDIGWNNTRSELGHLFHVTLNNRGIYDTFGNPIPGGGLDSNGNWFVPWGVTNQTFVDAGTGVNSTFFNFTNVAYWEQELSGGPGSSPLIFFAESGFSTTASSSSYSVPWAVHDGDVAAVPIPATAWLFGPALAGLMSATRRKKS